MGHGRDPDRLNATDLIVDERVRGSRDMALKLDWMLPNDEFDRQVLEGLARHFPELTEDARRVIVGNYSYSHAQ